jgi:hypothetical protein
MIAINVVNVVMMLCSHYTKSILYSAVGGVKSRVAGALDGAVHGAVHGTVGMGATLGDGKRTRACISGVGNMLNILFVNMDLFTLRLIAH